ncbi:MAG: DUF3421 domain-containing protein [Spirochaetaceae bacterium]|nr:DUF3421 domain-containing protein [Spirochaetaceae bacterium]
MKRLISAIALFIVAVSAVAIVGGEWVDGARHKYVVYVETLSGPCTGVLIEPTWVLTAAHCVVEHDGSIRPGIVYDVEVGYPGSFETNGSIVRVLAHPDYYWQGAGFRHDVALIELQRPFQRYDVVPIVKAASGMEGIGLGWGWMENDRNSDEGLRWFDAPVMVGPDCRRTAQFQFEDEIANDLTICTIGDDEEGRINRGDSGGPLVVRRDDGSWGLLGIASITGDTADGRTVVSVYADAWQALPWIESVMSGTAVHTESVAAAVAPAPEGLPANLRWEPGSGGTVPSNAIPAGSEVGGTPLYICRAEIEGGTHPGKTRERIGSCAVAWGGREHYINPYEVLVAVAGAESVTVERADSSFEIEQLTPFIEEALKATSPDGHPDWDTRMRALELALAMNS